MLNYSKYYTALGASDIGLTNSFFNPNDNMKLYFGAWYSSDGTNYGDIIGKTNKNTGDLSILKGISGIHIIFFNNRCHKFIWNK